MVEDVYLSQIHYYEFDERNDNITFTFDIVEDNNLYIMLGVPKIDRLGYFDFVMEIKNEYNKIIYRLDTRLIKPELMYEFFGDSFSWQYLRYDEPLKEGMYKVVITSEEKGKVWIAFGKREEFTTEQIISLPKLIKGIRDFHELEGRTTWEKYALG